MSAIRQLRPRLVVLVAALGLLGASCTIPSNSPEAYDDVVQENFLAGCAEAVLAADLEVDDDALARCECRFDVFVELVPYDSDDRDLEQYEGYPERSPTFVTLQSEVRSDPAAIDDLPPDVRAALGECDDVTAADRPAPDDSDEPDGPDESDENGDDEPQDTDDEPTDGDDEPEDTDDE
jgi:hypothetical protein